MKEYLKVKVLSLIEERRIIKTQEDRVRERLKRRRAIVADKSKWPSAAGSDSLMRLHNTRDEKVSYGLWQHKDDLASLCRLTHLAYGFVRGRTYPEMEAKVRFHGPKTKKLNETQLRAILDMVKKYDENKHDIAQRWGKFLQDAENVPVIRIGHCQGAHKRRVAYNSRHRRTEAEWRKMQTGA